MASEARRWPGPLTALLVPAGWNELLIASFSHRSVSVQDGILLATGLHVHRSSAHSAGVGSIFDRCLFCSRHACVRACVHVCVRVRGPAPRGPPWTWLTATTAFVWLRVVSVSVPPIT